MTFVPVTLDFALFPVLLFFMIFGLHVNEILPTIFFVLRHLICLFDHIFMVEHDDV
jgi:hypothetical protein